MESRTIPILSIILLVKVVSYVHLQESDNADRCLTLVTHGNCSCCKSGFRGYTCNDSCEHCLSRLGTEQSCTYYCKPGHYGATCDKSCPKTCASSISGPKLCKEKYGLPFCVKCIPGFHGTQCDLICDANCLHRTCYQTDGECLNCKSNDSYGVHCRLSCNKGCVSGSCNRTGHCIHGCEFGLYGERCESRCGSNCKQGNCTRHASHTYNCTEGCHSGYWGTPCLEKCPNHCIECEQKSGRCTSCVQNYVQEPETKECVEERKPDVGILVNVVIVVIGVIISGSFFVFIWKRLDRHRDPCKTYQEVEQISDSALKRIKCRPSVGIIFGFGLDLLANAIEDKEVVNYTDMEGFPVSKGKTYQEVEQIADSALKRIKCRPSVGIIFGFGLDLLANAIEDKEVVNYTDMEGFPVSKVADHENHLVFGKLGGKDVVVMPGLTHCYEDYPGQEITLPVRTIKLMGVNTLFATNAAGAINTDFNVGDMMIIKDHLNLPGFAGVNSPVGIHNDRSRPRFTTMHGAYDEDLRVLAKSVAAEMSMKHNVHEGVYSMTVGPSMETATDCKYLRSNGVDAIGMSSIPEVTVAHQCNMKVFGLTLITNMCAMDDGARCTNIEKAIRDSAELYGPNLQTFVTKMISKIED